MEHSGRTAANHLIPAPYGIQYNCSKFKAKYVSNRISFKFQQDAYFIEYFRASSVSYSPGSNARITVAKETS